MSPVRFQGPETSPQAQEVQPSQALRPFTLMELPSWQRRLSLRLGARGMSRRCREVETEQALQRSFESGSLCWNRRSHDVYNVVCSLTGRLEYTNEPPPVS